MSFLSVRRYRNKNNVFNSGFSTVEVIVAVVIMALAMTAVFRMFVSGGKSSKKIVNNLILNEGAQKIVDEITNDVREANSIVATMPPAVTLATVANLKTNGAGYPPNTKNALELIKLSFKFGANQEGLNNYEIHKITYTLEQETPGANNPWILFRSEVPLDPDTKAEIIAKKKKRKIAGDIKDFIFYRISDSANTEEGGSLNVHFKFLMKHKEDPNNPTLNNKYANEVQGLVRLRGGQL